MHAARQSLLSIALLALVVVLLPAGCSFVFGGIRVTTSNSNNEHPQRSLRAVGLQGDDSLVRKPETSSEASWVMPNWTSILSIAVAFGIVARFACGPALADNMIPSDSLNPLLQPPANPLAYPVPEDPELAAQEARVELQKANEDRKIAEKEARLKERLAIRKMAEDKKKAEQVIQENVRAEVDKIALERRLALESAQDRQREALQKAIAANRLAEETGEEKRLQKLNITTGMEPAKKALTRALAQKQAADEDVAYRKNFADKATARLEEADKLAAEKKAEVEKAVGELAKAQTL